MTIVVISRLAYRKGVDLLVASAPRVCAKFPQVRFLIGGDGPKMIDLLQMREKYLLQDRIELVGAVGHGEVRELLVRGEIYLNTSLTEAFGIGLLEAACAGLYIVSTRVGGVPEVLPEDMITFSHPNEDGRSGSRRFASGGLIRRRRGARVDKGDSPGQRGEARPLQGARTNQVHVHLGRGHQAHRDGIQGHHGTRAGRPVDADASVSDIAGDMSTIGIMSSTGRCG